MKKMLKLWKTKEESRTSTHPLKAITINILLNFLLTFTPKFKMIVPSLMVLRMSFGFRKPGILRKLRLSLENGDNNI